jgi:hypothetical protein
VTVGRHRIGAAAFAAVTASLLLLASGCGGSKTSSGTTAATTTTPGTVSTASWADSFCGAVYTWGTSIRSVGKSLQSPSRAKLQSAITDIKTANEKLVSSLQSLGQPDVKGGGQVKATVDHLASTTKTHSDNIGAAVSSLHSGGNLASAAATIGSNLVAIGNTFRSSLTQLQSASQQSKTEIRQAFAQSSSCKKIQSQTAG